MQKTIKPPALGQGASCAYQRIQLRPGVGVRVSTINPASWAIPREVPEQLQESTRGKVKGFSRWSAQRLRDLLFRLDYPPEECFGVALTSAPWVKRKPEDAFKALQREVGRCKAIRSAVWRKEVTRRGVPHFHLVVWASSPGETFAAWHWVTRRWVHHLIQDGVCPGVAFLSGSKAFRGGMPSSPASWAAFGREALASVNCVLDLRPDKPKDKPSNLVNLGSVSAVQYLCDHTSKHKAYQALTEGRAWGVWNRARLPVLDVPGFRLDDCPRRLVGDIRRALGKMSRYWWPDKDAPFGYRWSRERRFASGRKVLFRPAAALAVRRLVESWQGEAGTA